MVSTFESPSDMSKITSIVLRLSFHIFGHKRKALPKANKSLQRLGCWERHKGSPYNISLKTLFVKDFWLKFLFFNIPKNFNTSAIFSYLKKNLKNLKYYKCLQIEIKMYTYLNIFLYSIFHKISITIIKIYF